MRDQSNRFVHDFRPGPQALLAAVAILAAVMAGCSHPMATGADTTTAAGAVTAPTTVFLVRHAEKVLEGDDPALSDAGRVRAQALVHALGDAGLDGVYSTEFVRSLDTARPVAEHAGVEVTVFPARGHASFDDFFAAQAREILHNQTGKTVLVVGHSNTTPGVARALGAEGVPDLTEDDYDDLFQVVVAPSGAVHWVHLHYGAVTP